MNAVMPAILVVDDQPDVREALALLLGGEGYQVLDAADPERALSKLREQPVSLVLFDMNYTRDTTSGREGLDLLEQMRALDGDRPLVAMTAWGSIDLAVQALQSGAADFLEKPWDNNRLLTIVKTQLEKASALDRGPGAPAMRPRWSGPTRRPVASSPRPRGCASCWTWPVVWRPPMHRS